MILKGNSRLTALIGGICVLRTGLHEYEEVHATIVYKDGIITSIIKYPDNADVADHIKELKDEYDDILIIRLDNPQNPCYIFPGLVDIHNHLDYNMMPIWKRPTVQPWDNRHEWRRSTKYTEDITQLYHYIFENWSKYSSSDKNEDPYIVIQFFSELQAIAGGTTTLQEPTEISYQARGKDKAFREAAHILLRSTGVSTDMGLATAQKINSIVDFFKPDYSKLEEEAGKDYRPPIDTGTWEITEAAKSTGERYFREYLALLQNNTAEEISRKSGGYLVHLAEGRAGCLRAGEGLGYGIDAYSKKEFDYLKEEIRKIEGYAEKVAASRLTLIHGCGIDLNDEDDIAFINKCSVRVVWSPVSNLLLYDDTPKYLISKIRPELLCIGSDWAPSGSKHVWDEARFAQEFAFKQFYAGAAPENNNDTFLDMISYLPAQAIGSDKLGQIAEGSFADFYIVSKERRIPKQESLRGISDVFRKFSDYESVGTIIGGNLIFGTQELFDAFRVSGDRVVSLAQDMIDENGREITADEGAKDLRVYIPDVEVRADGVKSVVHIDFNAAIKTLDALFKDFNREFGKDFVRGRLLSSYDVPYREQIKELKQRFQCE